MDRLGEILNGTITTLVLLLLLLLGNYNINNTTPSIVNSNISNNDDISNNSNNNDEDDTNNTVTPLNTGGDVSEFLLNTDDNTDNEDNPVNNNGNGSSNSDGNGSNNEVDDTQVNGDAWIFTYPSIKYVALPVECIALTNIEEVAYVECILIRPGESSAYANITITSSHTPTYSPLPSDCMNCKEFNASFSDSAPDMSGEWKARALFYSSSDELIAERETSFLVYNAGGGSGGGSERFMVMPESMLGVISVGIASLASFAAYSLIGRRKGNRN